jgi:hypothetical protein
MNIQKASSYRDIKNILKKVKEKEVLYRGSYFLKRRTYPRTYQNSKYIFSTNFLELAISYIRCKNFEEKFKIAQGIENDQITLIEMDKKNEIKEMFSCNGYLYVYDKKKFEKSKFEQLKKYEYISTKIQKPILIIHVKNVYKIIKEIEKKGMIHIIRKK